MQSCLIFLRLNTNILPKYQYFDSRVSKSTVKIFYGFRTLRNDLDSFFFQFALFLLHYKNFKFMSVNFMKEYGFLNWPHRILAIVILHHRALVSWLVTCPYQSFSRELMRKKVTHISQCVQWNYEVRIQFIFSFAFERLLFNL